MIEKKCPFCGRQTIRFEWHSENSFIECPSCGSYVVLSPNEYWLKEAVGYAAHNDRYYYNSGNDSDYEKIKVIISSYISLESPKWVSENRYPTIDASFIKEILNSSVIPRNPEEKAVCLLKYVNEKTDCFGKTVHVKPYVVFSNSKQELFYLIKEMEEAGYLKKNEEINLPFQHDGLTTLATNYDVYITMKGISFLKDRKDNSKKDSCFVAMWFNPSMDLIWNDVIKPVCLEAGYKPIRVDEAQFNGDITDRIIADIKESFFIIADLTGLRGGVYYEAGFARGLGKEVILCCKKDYSIDIKYDGSEKLVPEKGPHFDVNHLNTIMWSDDQLADFKQKLFDRIIATIGRGQYSQQGFSEKDD